MKVQSSFKSLDELRSLVSQDRWNEVAMSTGNIVKGVRKWFSNQHAVLGRSTLKDCIVKENFETGYQ